MTPLRMRRPERGRQAPVAIRNGGTGYPSLRRNPRPAALQGEGEVADERPRQPPARCGSLLIGRGIEDHLRLRREPDQILPEDAIERLVETHDRERGLDRAVLDPEGREARHARDPASGAIGVVQVPEIPDVDAGPE